MSQYKTLALYSDDTKMFIVTWFRECTGCDVYRRYETFMVIEFWKHNGCVIKNWQIKGTRFVDRKISYVLVYTIHPQPLRVL